MINQPSFTYQIRRSSRVKRTRIVVSAAKVEVVAPMQVLEASIDEFVLSKQGWIKSTLEKLHAQQVQLQASMLENFHQGAWISFQGEKYQLTIEPYRLKRVKIEFCNGFFVSVPDSLSSDKLNIEIKKSLIRWMKKEAKNIAEKWVEHYAQYYFLTPRSIRIKTQKSRWGSCGIHNDINLNWLLVLAPPKVFEYVIVHELCHIQHKNHAAAFWDLVGRLMPDYKPQRLWLKRHGAELMMGAC
jgi:predicted metal-dependent hydrolase